MLGLLVALLAGCSPMNQGAVTLDEASQQPMLVLNYCDDEGIQAVRVAEADLDGQVYEEGRTLWRIEATEPQQVDSVVVGVVPDGFREVVALSGDLPDGLVMMAENAGDGAVAAEQGSGYFRLGELRPGVLLQGGNERSLAALQSDRDANCSQSLFGSFGLPTWLDGIAAVVVVLGILVAIVAGVRARLRHPRRSAATPGSNPAP